MNTQEIIDRIHNSVKKTPVKVYVQEKEPVRFPESCRVFGEGPFKVVFGEWSDIGPVLEKQAQSIAQFRWKTTAATAPFPCWT